MNTITLVGHLQDDPARRDTTGGVVTTFRLAAQDRRHRLWIDVEAWGQLAGIATRLTRGRQVGITGKLRNKPYTNAAGERRDHWYVAAIEISFLHSPEDGPSRTDPGPAAADERDPEPAAAGGASTC